MTSPSRSTPRTAAGLSTLGLVALEQLGRISVEHVAQNVEHPKLDRLGMPLGFHEPLRARVREFAAARHRELVGVRDALGGHEFGKSQAHVEHATNVCTLTGSRKIVHTGYYALARAYDDVYTSPMPEPMPVPGVLPPMTPEIAAMDESHDPVCVICRASFRAPGSFLCPACLGERDESSRAAECPSDHPHGHAA